MKGWWIVVVLGVGCMMVGCGFVVPDEEATAPDYLSLVTALQPLTNAKGSSYGISLSGTNELKPQVYHAPWGKSYLFFMRQNEMASYDLYAAEILEDGEMMAPKRIQQNLMMSLYAVYVGESNGVKVALLQRDGGVSVLGKDLSLSSSVVLPHFYPYVIPVWNGTGWELWPLFGNGTEVRKIKISYSGSWTYAEENISSASEVVEFFMAPIGGIGVISPGETNFVMLRTMEYSLPLGGTTSIFQQIVVSLKGNTVTTNIRPVYPGLVGVGDPFVDGKTYEVYFAREESFGSGINDLYRFRYLTWEKVMPAEIRAKLP
ncbi:hypothetical protein BREVNS_1695 [Brevinematales bacterium NS]|nr:hypothetical protein BREVNS_1695 [Brevinematales bacterium NS]